jgi:alpha-L-rhamnosidase
LQISAVNPKVGATFECSDSRLNAIHDMVKHTLSCLTFNGYMVDCPHIERMGYGGDGNSSTMTLQTIWDVHDTYLNWLRAWEDAMDSTGDLPYVAPAFHTGGGPYWSGFIVKAPWRTYLNYGDHSLIHRYYSDMKRWLEYIERHSNDYILQPWADNERHSWFLGDWAVPEGVDKGGESVLHASSCFISDCLADMVRMASMTGHPDDAQHYAAWRQNLNASIHRHFYHPETHTYANGTPLDQCYALLMGIPPDSITAAAVKTKLIADCHDKYRDHIAAGLMGVPVFTEWCIRERQADLMATILRQPDYPGYLYMIENGATTTWESWDCGRPGKEDRSRVHNCYNGIGIWFYQALAGIRPDPEEPGYRHFFIDPQPCDGVEWVKATKPTPYGTIRVDIEKGQLKVEIPQGTTATVFPGTPKERQLTSGKHFIKL